MKMPTVSRRNEGGEELAVKFVIICGDEGRRLEHFNRGSRISEIKKNIPILATLTEKANPLPR